MNIQQNSAECPAGDFTHCLPLPPLPTQQNITSPDCRGWQGGRSEDDRAYPWSTWMSSERRSRNILPPSKKLPLAISPTTFLSKPIKSPTYLSSLERDRHPPVPTGTVKNSRRQFYPLPTQQNLTSPPCQGWQGGRSGGDRASTNSDSRIPNYLTN